MPTFCVLWLAAGCFGVTTRDDEDDRGGAAAGSSAGSASVACEGDASTIAAVDRSCQADGDCVLVQHTIDCCGSQLIMGINAGAVATFAAAEEHCAPEGICDCVAGQTGLEDGTSIPAGAVSYVAACVSGRCQSAYSGKTSGCFGDLACIERQFCKIDNPPNSEATASCNPTGDCTDCECLPVAPCSCEGDGSGFMVAICH